MHKERSLVIKPIPSLNRGVVLMAYPGGFPLSFSVMHHKTSSALQIELDSSVTNAKYSKNNPMQNGEITFNLYRNLDNSVFCKNVLEVESIENDTTDYRSNLLSLNHTVNGLNLEEFQHEKLDIDAGNRNGYENSLEIRAWKFVEYDEDYMFYYFKRQGFNIHINKTVIRTAAIEFYTRKGKEVLDKIVTL